MILAIDFDDTILDRSNVEAGYKMGKPEPGAITALTRLTNEGNQIVIFTARNVNRPDVHKAVEDWLNFWKIPHHGITNIKQPYFDFIIDNRAITFDTWPQVLARLTRLQQGATT